MKFITMLVAMLTMFSTSLFAFEINNPRTWGYEIKCDSGELRDIKQVNGQWQDPTTMQLYSTMEAAAAASCSETE